MAMTEEIRRKIHSDPDFVNLKRFDYSLEKLMQRYPEGGVPTKIAAQALLVTEEEYEELVAQMIDKLRSALKVEI